MPVTQTPPAGHAAAEAQFLEQLLPWDTSAQHEQNAVECHLVAHPRAAALGRGDDYRQQWRDLFEQRGADLFVLASTHAASNAANDQAFLAPIELAGFPKLEVQGT